MARRKDKGAQGGETVTETVIETLPGETHIHRTVREWHPHAPERLSEIEGIIDSWGRRPTDPVSPARQLDYDQVSGKVDKLTRRVKGSREVVVQETVTEWEDREVAEEPAYTPVAHVVEAAPLNQTILRDDGTEEPAKGKRGFLGFWGKKSPRAAKPKKDKKPKSKPADVSEPEYQPQCAALTEDGQQCRNSARGVSRYCSSHKGYQPPTAKGLAQRIEQDAWDPHDDVTDHESVATADTRPVVRQAKDTRIKVRKAPKRKTAKKAGRKKR